MNQTNASFKLITSEDAFLELESQWSRLLSRLSWPTIFNTHAWMRIWWDTVRTDEKLLIVVAQVEDEVVAIAPLMQAPRVVRHLESNDIRFISTLKPAHSPLSFTGMQDFIIKPGYEHLLPNMLDTALDAANQWTYLFLQPIPENSPYLDELLTYIQQKKLNHHRRVVIENAVQNIEGDFSSYFASLSKNMRKNVKRALRNFQTNRRAGVKVYQSPEELQTAYSLILQIEANSWKAQSGIAINNKVYHNFYQKLISEFARQGWINIYILYIDDQPVAYDLNVIYNGMVKTLKGSFNRDYADYSPGAILTYHETNDYYSKQYRSFDLLWGNLEYKQKWTSSLERHLRIEIVNRHMRARLVSWLEHSPTAITIQQRWDKR